MRIIDSHIHIHSGHPELLKMLEEVNLKALNISVPVDNEGKWRETRTEEYRVLYDKHPEAFAWCTGFDLPRFDDSGYADACIKRLEEDFKLGAVGCKAWKNIGMEVKKPDGTFIQIDDELFKPIFDWLEANGKTTILHLGEPLACWLPLREGHPHTGYYKNNPEWHMYNKPEFPSHETIMAARDRLVEDHPKLRVVGAHLGSLEWDTDVLSERLAKFENFAVDTSARLWDLVVQDREKVRNFILRFPDRILHGTDSIVPKDLDSLTPEQLGNQLDRIRSETAEAVRYYSTDETWEFRGSEVTGLDLPEDVVEKILKTNVRDWYPGVD